MNLAVPAARELIPRLASLAECGRAEGYACIRARREHGAQSVEIGQPHFAVLLQGRKQVRCGGVVLDLVAGDLLVLSRACRIDVVNVPDPGTGLYLSVLMPLCEEVLAAARLLWREPLPEPGAAIARLPAAEFGPTLLQWQQALREARYAEARLALATMAVELCRRGHGGLLLPPVPSFACEVRALVGAQPGRDWRSRDLEDALGVSGATLRRRLAAEQTHLRELIAEARLAQAMQLLYTTRLPLKTVAARVGYRSVTSFSRRFQARYGLEPGAIGNAHPAAARAAHAAD